MKKTLVCILALMAVLVSTFTASAENGSFLDSPSKNDGPIIIEGENEDEDCLAEIIVTPYSKRHLLSDELRELLELAYSQISGTDDLSTLCSDLEDVAKKHNIKTTDISISDLFDMRHTDCENHEEHGSFKITLELDSLDNFVALMHLGKNGWEIIENAEVQNNGKQLVFEVDDFSPFAIAVKEETTPSKPGDTSDTWMFAIIMVVSAASIVVLAMKLKKKAK